MAVNFGLKSSIFTRIEPDVEAVTMEWIVISEYIAFLFSPRCPEEMEWSKFYPKHFHPNLCQSAEPSSKRQKVAEKKVEFADIGCGYGGLLGNFMANY